MNSKVTITICGWDQNKAWLSAASYPPSWLESRLVSYGMGRRQAKRTARQYGLRKVVTFPPLDAKDQSDLDSLECMSRQMADVGAIVEVTVVKPNAN